jgi:hypothetical protein
VAQQSIGEISSAGQAIIDRLSKFSRAHLFLWVVEDEPQTEQRVYYTHYSTITNKVAKRHKLVLNPRVVAAIQSHADHHNDLVQLAADPPEPNTLQHHGLLMDQDWTESVYLDEANISLLELVTKAARQAVQNPDDQESYSSYLHIFNGKQGANRLFQDMTHVVMSRLDLYKVSLEHIPDIYRHLYSTHPGCFEPFRLPLDVQRCPQGYMSARSRLASQCS